MTTTMPATEYITAIKERHTSMATAQPVSVIDQHVTDKFALYHSDCVEGMRGIPDNSIGYGIFSPPFGHSLYTYSNSPRDMGNGKTYRDFSRQYAFLARELKRTIEPGRLVSVHCMTLPLMKERDGVIGLFDFRGSLIRMMQRAGFIWHSEVLIRKDPVTQMQRTKSIGLLYKQVKKDTTISRQAISDYLITFRDPRPNSDPVTKDDTEFTVPMWQNYAESVWDDINPSETLQYRSVREHDDEKHICPLQLTVIRRAIQLWTNPGDTVLTPFLGIGSEAYVALEMQRNAIGFELKRSYYEQAVRNCLIAEEKSGARTLFDLLDESAPLGDSFFQDAA